MENLLVEYVQVQLGYESPPKHLDVLVEIHNQAELERIQPIDFPFIGINNRNLSTFEVDLKTTKELSLNLKDKLVVSESGIKTREDID